jgi:hypothetical protein
MGSSTAALIQLWRPVMDTAIRSLPTPDLDVALTAQDRCDRCGAQAYLRAVLPTGLELLFCGHHGNAQRAGLLVAGASLQDETGKLTIPRESGFGG